MKTKIRLQVFLSHNGVCSRRKAFDLIQSGQVAVNGRIVKEPSTAIDADRDEIYVDGSEIKSKAFDYILLNKPKGVTTTKADQFAEKTVLELLPKEFQHLVPVGRLDKDTEGLLLLTNDGDVAYKLTHPKFNVGKTYFVRVRWELTEAKRKKLEQGIILEGTKTSPAKVEEVKYTNDQTEFNITIHEGRKRQVRLMCAKVGLPVIYLRRLTQGPLELGDLQLGKYRALTKDEIERLRSL